MVATVVARGQSYLGRAYEAAAYVWTETTAKVSLVFFFIVDWISPYLGPKIMAAYLWCHNIWLEVKVNWLGQQVDALEKENGQLAAAQPLLREQIALHGEQENNLLKEREALYARVARFERENHRLQEELGKSNAYANLMVAKLREVQGELELAKQKTVPPPQSVSCNDDLVPFYFSQLEIVQQQLLKVREDLPKESAGQVSLRTLERTLIDLRKWKPGGEQ
jgi:hypothetical protein